MRWCEALVAHVALLGDEETEHLTQMCGNPDVKVYDDDGDDVLLCAEHWPVSTVEREEAR